jgi:choline-sulfatase
VIVVGDHGEGLGEHHEDTHGIFLYDSTTHVPLIVKLPGRRNGSQTVNEQVRTMDILPTVLDILHVPLPGRLDGESLKPYFAGAESAARIALGETDYPLRFGWAPLRSVRQEGFKFIEAPRPELYNLKADPGELNNIYQPWNENVRKYRAILTAVRAKVNTPPAPPSAATVGQATLDELKALGYLGPADAGSSTNVPEPSLLPDPKDKIEEQNLLHRAMMASEDNRPDDARRSLEKVLQLDPKSPTALRQLGELELQAGEYGKASEHLKHAREVSPTDATAAFHEGQALQKVGSLAGARDALEASLKLLPGQFPARLLLGEVYLGLKETTAAEDQFEAALLLQPESVEAQLGLARVRIAGGRVKDAVEQLEALSKAQPNNAEIFELLAQAYREIGKNEDARKAETRANLLREKRSKP